MGTSSHIVIGLAWGDEGKGGITDALVRKTGASAGGRFNGGGQAAHNVCTVDGRHHTFSLWGSGTLAGARTILTSHVVVDPLAMDVEAAHLRDACGIADPHALLVVDQDALLATPYHRAMNRIREHARGKAAHGTCGVGIGEVMMDADDQPEDEILTVGDLRDPEMLAWKLQALAFRKAAEAARLLRGDYPIEIARDLNLLYSGEAFQRDIFHGLRRAALGLQIAPWEEIAPSIRAGNLVFEGAQGVLLDQWAGFHPHTTWSTTTAENALEICARAETDYRPTVVGVTRAYATRHGAGPFPTENPELAVPEHEHNGSAGPQGRFRIGALDLVLLRYAVTVSEPDQLAVTCVDHPQAFLPPCESYRMPGEIVRTRSISPSTARPTLERQEAWGKWLADEVLPIYEDAPWTPGRIAEDLKTPILVTSHGPTAADKRWS